MSQEVSTLKDVVNPMLKGVVNSAVVEKNITSPWRDFWNFKVIASETGDHVTVGTLVIAFICFVIGIIIARWLSRRLTKKIFSRFELSASVQHMWNRMSFYVLCILVSLIALKVAHIPLTVFTFMGGAVALGVGFGSKNLVNNFISGFIFLFEAPAKVGDFVEVDGYFGRVVDVGMRASQIELGMSRRAIVPNSNFLEKTIVNWGKAGSPIYISVAVSIDYNHDMKKVEAIILEKITEVPQVVEGLPKRVYLKSFADSGLNLEILFPVKIYTPGDRDMIASALRKKINEVFRNEKISIPFPQLVLRQAAPPEPT